MDNNLVCVSASVFVGILSGILYHAYTKNTETVIKREFKIPESYSQALEFYPGISDKTKQAFEDVFNKISKKRQVIEEKQSSSVKKDIEDVHEAEKSIEDAKKDLKWYCVSIVKGWEGVGVVFYLVENEKVVYVLGISEGTDKVTKEKYDQVEYPGGKPEMQDNTKEETVQRKVKEETRLELPIESFQECAEISGGNTGYPYYTFLVEITPEQYASLNPTKKLKEYIKVYELFDVAEVVDTEGKTHRIRDYNKKYAFPQIKDKFLEHRYQRLRATEASSCDHGCQYALSMNDN